MYVARIRSFDHASFSLIARHASFSFRSTVRSAADVEVADELLRDRRAALDDLARAHVLPERARDALDVDAAVLVEAPVLDRDRRLRHPRADLAERHRLAVPLGRDRAEQRVVGGVDERVLADRDRPQRVQVAGGAEGGDAA